MEKINFDDEEFYSRMSENAEKWNQYLMEYYDQSDMEALSINIRTIIQEWMVENIDVINCILNCDMCGGDKDAPGEAPEEIMTPLKCEEPVDVVFMVDGSDSVSASDWPLVLKWTNNLVNEIAPQDRQYSSSVVFQQFSRDPITQEIPDAIIGQFSPGDTAAVDAYKREVEGVGQSAQGTNTYETLNKVFGQNGLYYNLPTVTGIQPDGEEIEGATIFITLSDGESRDRETERDEATVQKLKKMSRMQIAVGVGQNYNKAELFDFAQDDKHILTYDDFEQLVEAGQQIINLIQEGCKSNELRNVAVPNMNQLEDENSYDSDPSSYPSQVNSYSSEEFYVPEMGNIPEMGSMASEDPRLDDIGMDFLDWTFYNHNKDKRHRHRR